MTRVRALCDTYVGISLRVKDEVFDFDGVRNPNVLEVVPDTTPLGAPIKPNTQLQPLPHEARMAPPPTAGRLHVPQNSRTRAPGDDVATATAEKPAKAK